LSVDVKLFQNGGYLQLKAYDLARSGVSKVEAPGMRGLTWLSAVPT
jgi:hypothetical protein